VLLRRAAGGFELISGERRWRAARLAGLASIPGIVREGVSDDQMLELALVENVQRQDLDPIEKARGYRGMMKALGLTQDGVAAKVGLRRSTVANHLRLLELPDVVRDAISKGLFSMGHAKALLGLTKAEEQVELMQATIRADLSVREIERKVRERLRPARSVPALASPEQAPWAREAEARMREFLGTKVTLTSDRKGERGQIVIEFHQRADLERLLALLAPKISV
jgi:ParB family chromosome partitioning protein